MLGPAQEEKVQRVAQRGAARRQRTTSKEPTRERRRRLFVRMTLLYAVWGGRELFFGGEEARTLSDDLRHDNFGSREAGRPSGRGLAVDSEEGRK